MCLYILWPFGRPQWINILDFILFYFLPTNNVVLPTLGKVFILWRMYAPMVCDIYYYWFKILCSGLFSYFFPPKTEAFSILSQAAMSLCLCPKGNRFVSPYPGGLRLLKEELKQRVSCFFPPCPYHWVIPNCMSVLPREVLSAFLHNSHAMEF